MIAKLAHSLALLALSVAVVSVIPACAEEVSHKETDKPGWFGGHTHEEETIYRNPDGTLTREQEKTTVK